MIRRLSTLLTGLVLAIAVAAPGSAAASTSPEYYGLNVQTLFRLDSVDPSRWGSYLDQMASGGMGRARIDAHWQYAEPRPPRGAQHDYTWNRPWDPRSSMDTQARLLASRGIRMVPVISHAPGWTPGPGTSVAPSHYADMAAFAAAFAGRYGPGGDFWRENPDLPVLPPHEYELWTEANSTIFWTGGPNPPEYVAALAQVRAALKAVDPSAKLLASLGWQDFEGYTRAMYGAGVRGLIDGVGFHPYAPNAPSIIALVQRMRQVLRTVGDGDLPIWLTETGQPASTGTGGPLADSGLVSDAARAATQSLTGDALARSDCDVRDFQVYSIVASETNREPISEGFMGVMRLADASPNATGAALLRASQRWRARQDGGIVLCNPGTTPRASLLPLDLQIDHISPTCVKGRTTYDGNPIEASFMVLTTPDGRRNLGYVNAFGDSVVCIPNGPPVWQFDVVSEISNVATSQRYRCTVPEAQGTPPPGLCKVVEEPVPLVPAATPSAIAASAGAPRRAVCRWQVTAKVISARRKGAKVRAGVGCKVTPKRVSFKISVQKGKRAKKVRTVKLDVGRTSTFTLPRKLRKGERVVLSNQADLKRKMPRLVARTASLGGADVAGTEGCDWKLETRVLGGAKSKKAKRSRVRARLTCPAVPKRKLRFNVSVQPKKAKKAKRARKVTLRSGLVTTLTVKKRLRAGDRVIVWRPADKKATEATQQTSPLPRLSVRARTAKKVVRKR